MCVFLYNLTLFYSVSLIYFFRAATVFDIFVLLWRESFITTGKKRYSCLSGGCALCGCVSFSFVAGKFYYDRKKKFYLVVCLAGCVVVSVFGFWLYILLCTWSTIQLWCCVSFFVVCLVGARSLLRPEKKIQLSVWQVRDHYYDQKKKRYSRLSGGCAVLAITTGKKKNAYPVSFFEHSICISSTWIKTNTNPLVQLQHIHYI